MPARVPWLRRTVLQLVAVASLATTSIACGSDAESAPADTKAPTPKPADPPGTPPGPDGPTVEEQLAERPWEVISSKGETLLPNVFYADASENEQIMPYALDGHVMIDRLVYPTLGNPNLYTKNDPADEFTAVLRIEDEAYAHLGLKVEDVPGQLGKLDVTNDPETGFAFLLVPRASREYNTEAKTAISSGNGTGVIRIYPNEVRVNPIPADMPAALKKRKTLRFLFKQGAMQKVPAGLYDLRFEVRKENDLYKTATTPLGIYEYQYNAIRVFDSEPEEHKVINVTDTQVSVGDVYDSKTKDKLSELVQFLNTTSEKSIKEAAFITFNGDLHNGGSPGSLRQRPVAWTYNKEAKAIVDALKFLPVPIFLTAGNHDGYVSTGHVPSAVKAVDTGVLDSLEEVVREIPSADRAWPDFSWSQFQSYIASTEQKDLLGGIHTDIFTGGFSRNAKGTSFTDGWKEVPRSDRNYILYDGFYQWQKTYGPLYFSWKFGKSHYVSMNSFELRQHRRSGWGMYTVNYGGGMSDTQMAWIDRELLKTKLAGDDVVLLAHHDPRGGHQSKDPGYYFEQLEYKSIYQSAINYLVGKVWNSAVCKLPDWALSRGQEDKCVHDGLQEWMRADEEFDCSWDVRKDGKCPTSSPYWFSGIELMGRVAKSPQVRTMLLGHTHYNQLEVLQKGEEFLPGQIVIDGTAGAQKFASLEVENPIRAFSFLPGAEHTAEYDEHSFPMAPVADRNARFASLVNVALARAPRTLDAPSGGPRELMVLRLVSNADLANQTLNGKSAMGFGILHITKKTDSRAYANAQINKATFFVNSGSNVFTNVRTVDLDRSVSLKPHDATNPIQQLFVW